MLNDQRRLTRDGSDLYRGHISRRAWPPGRKHVLGVVGKASNGEISRGVMVLLVLLVLVAGLVGLALPAVAQQDRQGQAGQQGEQGGDSRHTGVPVVLWATLVLAASPDGQETDL